MLNHISIEKEREMKHSVCAVRAVRVRWRRRHSSLVDSHTRIIVWIRVESLLEYSHEWSVR